MDKYSGWYSISDEAYYDEDEIIEQDGKKISKISGSTVDWVGRVLFFKLSKWGKELINHYESNPDFILTILEKQVLSFVKKG